MEGREAPSGASWPRTHTLWDPSQGLSRLLFPYFYLTQHDPHSRFSEAQMAALGNFLQLLPHFHSSNFISNSPGSTPSPCSFGQRQPCSVTIPPPVPTEVSSVLDTLLATHGGGFSCLTLTGQREGGKSEKSSLMSSGVGERPCRIGQTLQASASQP